MTGAFSRALLMVVKGMGLTAQGNNLCCVICRVNKPFLGTQPALPALLHPSASTPAGEESRHGHARDYPLLSLPAFLLQSH